MGQNFLGEFEELVLLAVLKLGDQNAYGVPIAEAIEEATGKRVSTGALYTTLARLEERGLISSRIGEATPARGGKAKKFFAIEIAGKETIRRSQQVRNNFAEGLLLA